MSILEKLKALFDAADQGKWTDLGRFHSIAFGVSESDEAIGNVFGIGICFDTSHLFARSILINDVSDLRSELFRISRDLLLAA